MGDGQRLPPEAIARLEHQFRLDGFVVLRGVLSPTEVDILVAEIERKHSDGRIRADDAGDHIRGVALMRMFEFSAAFRDLITREPVASLVESILGDDCHIISQNALRTPQNNGIVNWHIDGELLFPYMELVADGDERFLPPCFSLSAMWALSCVGAPEEGPTEIVPQSHRSGKLPPATNPCFITNQPKAVFVKAGDVYLLNHQLWHRGAQNFSTKVRYVCVTGYGRRFIQQRFFPFLNYLFPAHVMESASERTLRFLGKHAKGPFG